MEKKRLRKKKINVLFTCLLFIESKILSNGKKIGRVCNKHFIYLLFILTFANQVQNTITDSFIIAFANVSTASLAFVCFIQFLILIFGKYNNSEN